MSDNLRDTTCLVGAGGQALEYTKVLDDLQVPLVVIGRSERTAREFTAQTGKPVHLGEVPAYFEANARSFSRAIVVVSIEQLASASIALLRHGLTELLLEKPAGLTGDEIRQVAAEAKKTGAAVYVAYNRRFYASVLRAKEIIEEDGGVLSFNFEFTEWAHQIGPAQYGPGVKENWFLNHSTHVIDLAFYLAGKPKELSCYTAGGLDWHQRGSIYAGAGVTEGGALFSYQANWEAPGRWGVEILTRKRRLIFRPLEKLQVQPLGSVSAEYIDIDDELDTKFKPGLYRQVRSFLSGATEGLLSIQEQAENLQYYRLMNRPI